MQAFKLFAAGGIVGLGIEVDVAIEDAGKLTPSQLSARSFRSRKQAQPDLRVVNQPTGYPIGRVVHVGRKSLQQMINMPALLGVEFLARKIAQVREQRGAAGGQLLLGSQTLGKPLAAQARHQFRPTSPIRIRPELCLTIEGPLDAGGRLF